MQKANIMLVIIEIQKQKPLTHLILEDFQNQLQIFQDQEIISQDMIYHRMVIMYFLKIILLVREYF